MMAKKTKYAPKTKRLPKLTSAKTRKGLGKGKGKGYYNILPTDKPVHEASGRGEKQPQRVSMMLTKNTRRYVNVPKGVTRSVLEKKGKKVEDFETNLFGLKTIGSIWYYDGRFYRIEREIDGFGLYFAVIKPAKTTLARYRRRLTKTEKEKVTKNYRLKDWDGDGVANELDCDPTDPTKQDDFLKKAFGRTKELTKKGVHSAYEMAKKYKHDREEFRRRLQNMSDKQLYDYAVKYTDEGFFGGNPYKQELLRRTKAKARIGSELTQAKKQLDEELKKAKEAPLDKGFF